MAACIHFHTHALAHGNGYAHSAQELDHGRDIAQMRHIADGDGFRGEQRRGQDGQGGVFCA
jgi:hypothetical protein